MCICVCVRIHIHICAFNLQIAKKISWETVKTMKRMKPMRIIDCLLNIRPEGGDNCLNRRHRNKH